MTNGTYECNCVAVRVDDAGRVWIDDSTHATDEVVAVADNSSQIIDDLDVLPNHAPEWVVSCRMANWYDTPRAVTPTAIGDEA